MAILRAGTFKVSDFRKPIPNKVKLEVIAREFDFDHDPALVNRDYDTEAGDFIPRQNDPKKITARRKAEHAKKTYGREPGAEKTVTTRGSDVGEAARTKDIRASEAIHQATLASKAGDYTKAAELLAAGRERKKRPQRRIPSRPFARARRPLQWQKEKQFP
jgi:Mg-chelatase subunit ChlI